MHAAFDTLRALRNLEASGLDSEHAEAIVQVIAQRDERAATKADLASLEKRVATKADLSIAVNKMLLAQLVIGGLVVAFVRLL